MSETIQLPHNLEAEKKVLGAMMRDKEALSKGLELLDYTDFYQPSHATIFTALSALFQENQHIDILTLAERLESLNSIEKVGGSFYLAELAHAIVTTTGIEHHAKIVKNRSKRRKIINTCRAIEQKAVEDKLTDPDEITAEATTLLQNITLINTSGFVPIGQVINRVIDALQEKQNRIRNGGDGVDGLRTGLKDLDGILQGLKPGRVYVYAARPSVGKTTIALQIANLAGLERKKVGIFSFEMSSEELTEKVISNQYRINPTDGGDYSRIFLQAARDYHNIDILLNESCPGLEKLIAQTTRSHLDKPFDLLIIDYFTLIEKHRRKGELDSEHYAAISRQIKILSRRLNIPLILIAQLNRDCEKENREPRLSDLRSSGAVEQDADAVIFLHPCKPKDGEENQEYTTIKAIVRKNRFGKKGCCFLQLQGKYSKFVDSTEGHYELPDDEDVPF